MPPAGTARWSHNGTGALVLWFGSGCGWSRAWPTSLRQRWSRTVGISSYEALDEVWRRAGIPTSALERLAEADAFRSVGLNRRQALRAVKVRIPMHSAHPYRFQAAQRSNLKPPTVLTMSPTLFG